MLEPGRSERLVKLVIVIELDLVLVPRQEQVAGLAVQDHGRVPVTKVEHLDFEAMGRLDLLLVSLVAACLSLSLRGLRRPGLRAIEAPAAHAAFVQARARTCLGGTCEGVARHGNDVLNSNPAETETAQLEQKCAKKPNFA